jgi:hypothetical protein
MPDVNQLTQDPQPDAAVALGHQDPREKVEGGHSSSTSTFGPSSSDAKPWKGIEKHLTVTFKALSVQVAQRGTDFGETFMTCLDPREYLKGFHSQNLPQKVTVFRIIFSVLSLTACSTSYVMFLVK